MASGPITSWEIDGETVDTVAEFIFFWSPKSLQILIAALKFANKGLSGQGYGFSSGHVWM